MFEYPICYYSTEDITSQSQFSQLGKSSKLRYNFMLK